MTRLPCAAVCLILLGGVASSQYGDIGELKLAKPEDKVDHKSEPPPKEAKVLFDGKNFDNWTKTDRKSAVHWKLIDGGIMQVEKGGDICTKDEFDGQLKLHVEFRVPYMP